MIRFYYRIDPDELTDDEWCYKVQELDFVLNYTGKIQDKKEVLDIQTNLNKR